MTKYPKCGAEGPQGKPCQIHAGAEHETHEWVGTAHFKWSDGSSELTPSEVEADFQGRHNRENLGNVIGWVIVEKDGSVWNDALMPNREAAVRLFKSYDFDSLDSYDVFPVVRTL